MAWGVYDYPEPDLKWEREHFMDDEEEYTDEWEDFCEDEYDEDFFP